MNMSSRSLKILSKLLSVYYGANKVKRINELDLHSLNALARQ